MDSTASTTGSRSDSARLPFTLENKSSLPTSQVRAILSGVTDGLDTAGVHVIVKNRRRSPDRWLFDPDPLLPTRLRGISFGWSGHYSDLERLKKKLPHIDMGWWRDRPPKDATALVVLCVGKDASIDWRLNWLAQVARHEFMHHFQRLHGRCTKTPGKYLRDPIEIEARAAEAGDLPWQKAEKAAT